MTSSRPHALKRRHLCLSNTPITVQRFLQAYKQVVAWIHKNKKAADKILVRENKLSPEAAALNMNHRNILFELPNDDCRNEPVRQANLLARLRFIKQEPN